MHRLILMSILLIAVINGYGQPKKHEETVHITRFSGGCPAAVCYAFDDGLKDQYDLAIPMLEKFGFHATFFVIPSCVIENNEQLLQRKEGTWGGISWNQLKEMAKNGHEIASHSWSHKNMKNLSDEQLSQEINKADSMIEVKLGVFPLTFAYPYNAFDERVHQAVLKNHIAAREFQFGIGHRFTAESGNQWVEALIKTGTWGITMIHGISIGFDSLTSPQVLEDHFRYVKRLQAQGKVWVSTFASISKYIAERDQARLTVKWGKNKMKLTVISPLDDKIYNQPLTVAVSIKGAVSANAKQGGKQIPVIISADKILIDILPGGGTIDIQRIIASR